MNIDQYISGGIVESYVLGLASEEERSEFEQLCLQYPELVAARNQFEKSLEKQAFQLAITPPQNLKEIIFNKIVQSDSAVKAAKLISMDARPGKSSWLRYAAAAAIILLLASAYFAYDQYSENKRLKSSFSQLQSQVDSINSINEILVKEKRKTNSK